MSLAALVAKNQVVMFTLVPCPFCARAKEILRPIAKDMRVYECDQIPNGEELRKEIYNQYKQETVPAIFINREFIGGCSDLQELQKNGELAKKLAAVIA